METRAREATGLGQAGLRAKAFEKRIQSMHQLRELVDLVVKLEREGGDASLYHEQLNELLPNIVPAIAFHLDATEEAVEKVKRERETAPAGERMEIEQRITRQSQLVAQLLRVAVDVVAMMDELSIDSTSARELASKRLGDRSRITAGRIELLQNERVDAKERLVAAPDDADIQSTVLAHTARLDADSKSLGADIALMDKLGLDTAVYKQLLIESTGEITADVFDATVARGLLESWLASTRDSIADNGPRIFFKIVLFLAVLAAFWLLSHFVARVTARAVEADNLRFSELLKRMIVALASVAVKMLGVLVALSQLGVQVGPLLAGLGIAGFIVGFALQDTLANFAAGAMILAYRPYDVGDIIDCAGGVFGKVSHMNLVSTTMLTFDNQTKVVPNGKIWGDVITNVTAQKIRRVDLTFGISYSDDMAHAEKILWSIVDEHEKILTDPEPVVKLHELGDSSVNYVVRPWVSRDDYWDVYWDVTRETKVRFDREGISIPFPQRDVHVHPVSPADAAAGEAKLPLAEPSPHEATAETSHTETDGDD